MSSVAEQLKTTLSTLSQSERAELAYFLIKSLDQGADDDVDAAWLKEIDARREEVISGADAGVDSDIVIARARELLR